MNRKQARGRRMHVCKVAGRTLLARRTFLVGSFALAAATSAGVAWSDSAPLVAGPAAAGASVTPQGFRLTPAGRQVALGPGPLAVAVTKDGSRVLVTNAGYDHHSLSVLDAQSGAVLQDLPGATGDKRGFYVGLTLTRDDRHVYASDGSADALRTFELNNGSLSEGAAIDLPDGSWPAGIALAPGESRLYVVANLRDSLLILDRASGALLHEIPVGHLPYAVALSADGARAYVSNWGANSLSVVDTVKAIRLPDIGVGTHPSALMHDAARGELFVANSDSDDVSVIDTRRSKLIRSIDLRPFPGAPVGAAPNALALSPDGQTLYVANAGNNDVAVIGLARRGQHFDRALGLIPTGWYPSALAVQPQSGTLYVANMKGLGIGPVAPGEYIADMLRGSLSIISAPSPRELRAHTRAAWQNFKLPNERRAGHPSERIIPSQPGGKTPIEHVIYVLKENRTFDQVLGDLGRGNGDPTLTLFGEEVTPNQHELARRFVTFDNFYADGEVSADGWTWASAANANTYNQKNWPLDYGVAGRLYDFGGFGNGETAAFPGKDSERPFFWDRLAERAISYRNYGFFVNGAPVTIDSSMPGLVGHTDLDYAGWDMSLPDQVRIDEWLREFRGFEHSGQLPRVQFVYLPRDHTEGTYPGVETPRAMVADNDLALGRLVEAVSHSRFWPSTAIFVTEDDAQDGPDHVDGHRTLAFVVSPYTQTGKVDSTFYSTVSVLRTAGLIVGVPPLTQFDALTTPMWAAFTNRPKLLPYRARMPGVPLGELNLPEAPLARASRALDFSRPDSADHRILNDAIWKSVRGASSAQPQPRVAFALPAGD